MSQKPNLTGDSNPNLRAHAAGLPDSLDISRLPEDVDPEPSGVIQELTAYLDGELSPDEVAQVEKRLNQDPAYRAQMQALQRTWEAFDVISNEELDDTFVRTTMEMVAADAKSSVSAAPLKTRYFRSLLTMLIPLGIFLASYTWTWRVQTQPHRLLLQNFDLIERFDQYQKTSFDFEFLVKLKQRDLFSDSADFAFEQMDDLSNVVSELDSHSGRKTNGSDSLEERLESLSLAEKQQLKLNFDAYLSLPRSELSRVNEFHRKLQLDPEQNQLLSVLNKYYQWLKVVGPSDRARLLDADVESRLNEIARLLSEQSRIALGRQGATSLPLDRDQEHLMNWFNFTVKSNELLFRRALPRIVSEYQQRSPTSPQVPAAQLALLASRAPLNQIVAILLRADRAFIRDTIYQDIDLLKRGLSFEAQVIIADQDPDDQKTLILNWIETVNRAKSAIPEEKLQTFYEQLPAEQRDKLDRMSMEDWVNTLGRMYRDKNAARIDVEPLFFEDF